MASRTPGRIMLPSNVSQLLDLAEKIYAKHQLDGTTSPLNAQQDFSWTVEGPKVAPCLNTHDKAEASALVTEKLFKERDKDLPDIKAIVKNSAQLLKNVYAKNPKVLGDYGFIVDDSKQVKKPKL